MTLASGTALAQAVTILVAPVLTRLYSTNDFGVFTIYLAILSIFSVFITGRYEFAILVAKNDKEAWDVVWSVTIITITVSLTLGLLALLFRFLLTSLANIEISITIILLSCIALVVTGTYQALYYWSNRHKYYKRLAFNRLLGSIAVAMISCILGVIHFGPLGLIIGSLLGQVVNMTLLFTQTWPDRILHGIPSQQRLAQVLRRYIDYPKFLIPSGILERVASQSHIFLLSIFFGVSITGLIGLYQRVVSIPTRLIGTSVSDVFKQQAAQDISQVGNCQSLFRATVLKLIVIAIGPFLILLFFAPVLFEWVFGAEWRVAGEFGQILSFTFFFGFIVSPVSSVFYIAEKQKYDLFMQAFLLTSTTLALLGGYLTGSAKMAIGFFTIAYCMKYTVELYLSYRISAGELKR